MPGRGTKQQSIRIPDELWRAALAVAKRRGETLNGVLRAALERYVTEHEDEDDEAERG